MSFTRYLAVAFGLFILAFTAFVAWGVTGRDSFAAIPLNGDKTWYRNYGDHIDREIQDRDILYHHIGHSIDEARKADIIILGHSMLLWGLRWDQIEDFEKKYGVRIYNLGSAGDGSGEFLRLVVKRWNLHPKLWIINADDNAANFFSVSLDDFGGSGPSAAINVVKYGRLSAYLDVAGRNVRWRIQDWFYDHMPDDWHKSLSAGPGQEVWRNIDNGNWNLEHIPAYMDPGNQPIKLHRDPNCPATPKEIDQARNYIDDIGGHTILTLLPYVDFCRERVEEIAKTLNLETIIPPDLNYTSEDGGGHLDKKGAIAFTDFFLDNLAKTKTFQQLFPAKTE